MALNLYLRRLYLAVSLPAFLGRHMTVHLLFLITLLNVTFFCGCWIYPAPKVEPWPPVGDCSEAHPESLDADWWLTLDE